jgi:uncharacterized membrane protein YgcG
MASALKLLIRGLTTLLIIAAAIFLFHGTVHAVDITLGWLKNTEADLFGYKIYYTKTSFDNLSKPSDRKDVALDQLESPQDYGEADDMAIYTISLPDLAEGEVYYLAISAYNLTGLESPISEVINTQDNAPDSGGNGGGNGGGGGGSGGGCFLRMMVTAHQIK